MDLRQRTIEWIKSHGSKKSWIAEQLQCTAQHIHYYLLGERNLCQEKIDKLETIISK